MKPDTWPDGTPKSPDNVFTTPYGVPIDTRKMQFDANCRQRASSQVVRAAAEGRNLGVRVLQNSVKAQRKTRA